MTDEEKKAIEYVNNILDYELHYCEDEDVLLLTRIDKEQIKTILNLIQKHQKEIEELKTKYDKDTHILQNQLDVANADIIKKDKTINLMAILIANLDTDEDICKHQVAEFCEGTDGVSLDICVKCIKQYFEKKVREEND